MSVLSVAIIILFIVNHLHISEVVKMNIAWGMVGALFLAMFVFIIYAVYRVFKNTKRFNKFRSTLKIGDMTDEGIVMDIEGDEVTIAKTTKLHLVYPPKSDDDNINLI